MIINLANKEHVFVCCGYTMYTSKGRYRFYNYLRKFLPHTHLRKETTNNEFLHIRMYMTRSNGTYKHTYIHIESLPERVIIL